MKWLERIESHIVEWFTSSESLRFLSAELRDLAPIADLGGRTIVSRYDDVLEVLDNDGAFGVTSVYGAKMARTTGDFFLGMENTPQYQREVGIARRAVKTDDAPRIAAMVTGYARTLIDEARSRGGVFDAVNEFFRVIPLQLVADYFGVPGPDPDTMKRWMRIIFWDIFLNPNDDPAVVDRSRVASSGLKPYLIDLVAQRKRQLTTRSSTADDFVTRMLRQQATDPTIDDDLIRRNVGGVIVGAVDTQSKAMAHAVDQLLRKPSALESAKKAARANDDVALTAHVWEALRYNPHNPALFRTCSADTVIAAGTDRQKAIAKGTSVLAFTISAMFDPHAWDDADAFRTDRPLTQYLHFGHGQHTCFGARLNAIVLPLAIKPLLLLDGLRYDEAGSGKIEYEGPFPDRMMLRFDVPD